MPSTPQLETDFIKTFHSLTHKHAPWKAFSDWLEITAISLHQLPYHHQDFPQDDTFAALETKYLDAIKPYSRDELNTMAKLMGLTLQAHQQSFSDFLGKIASDQNLLNKDQSQFFTPYNICQMMAQMILSDAPAEVEQKGILTINEPASGGGALIIAAAEALYNQQIDPRSCAQFDATDVSRNAFNMTYIQLCALDLQAIVRHGNTLSMEIWESRPTPQLRYFDQWLKQHQDIARLERLRDLIVNPEAFFNTTQAEVAPEPAADAPAEPQEPTPQSEEDAQPSLFDLDTFAADATKPKRPRRKADITLPRPEDRQLDLFGRDEY